MAKKKCKECKGTGSKFIKTGIGIKELPCFTCNGTGEVENKRERTR
jgi:DnaJ-class molecular chaperone